MIRAKLLCCLRSLPVLLAAILYNPFPAAAHALSTQECSEGADYIRNAALSRDGGMSEIAFMEVFDNDLVMLMAIPPTLRWFVQDDEDAEFLRSALHEVFRKPQRPETHAETFAEVCLLRAGEWSVNGKMRT
jgi:hypothetical protein